MVIGNPYCFSIFTEIIKEWNTKESGFNNGIFLISVGGDLFPKQIFTATLGFEINSLKKYLSNITINKELFDAEKEKAFINMYNSTFAVAKQL